MFTLIFACTAHGSELVSVDLTADLLYDDNLFRLPQTADAKTIIGGRTDDVVSRLGVQLNWDVPLSLQRITGNASFIANRFENNDQLNNDSLNVALGWEGELAKVWKGIGKWRREKNLASFADVQDGQRSIVTQNHIEADVTRELFPQWKMMVHWDRDTSARSLASQQYNDRNAEGMRLGIIGQSPADSEIKIFLSSRTVKFVNWVWLPGSLQDDGLREDALGVALRWSITDSTTAETGARIERVRGAHLSQNDFSGSTYDLALSWDSGAALKGQAAVWRNIDAMQNSYASYMLSHGGRLIGQWSVRSAWVTKIQMSHEWFDYKGGEATTRREMLNEVSLSQVYIPFRNAEISVLYSQTMRDSRMRQGFLDHIIQGTLKINWD